MKKVLIFDFDGTLINTNHLIEEGLDVFAVAYRGWPLSREEHQMLAGKPLTDQMAHISPSKWEEMTDSFRAWYLKAHVKMAKPFDGMAELLAYLITCDYKLAIVSNNSRATIDFGLKQLEMEHCFSHIITCDDVREKKPSPEGLEMLLKQLGADPEDCLFIGDSANDILAGKRAGIDSVLVGWTAVDRHSLLALEPDFMIEEPHELLQLIEIAERISA